MVDTLTEYIHYALTGGGGPQLFHLHPIAAQGEVYMGIYQCYPLKGLHDVVHLSSIGLEKLTSGGYVEEEVFNEEVGTYGA